MWKDIKGFENLYQINEKGEVFSLKTRRLLKPQIGTHGYLVITLRRDGKNIGRQIHRMIAEAFIPNPENKPCIDHINAIRTDNRIDNLRWCTYKENNNNPIFKKRVSEKHIGMKLSKESIRKRQETKLQNGKRINRSLNNGKSKEVIQYDKDMNEITRFPSLMEVFRALGFHPSNIGNCCNGRKKSAYGFFWNFS